ncbi:hypothetical protein NDU88_001535 [Pleurodeles waltl]|uniref:Uncharacterized protein n=1 Tax=Pleurodeles waltl TaxID=8319 RepID=A0AAV7NBF3_PLEWA|nr:hypothetical protein NDU88_001535 [Pleurodeles waltl]
MTEGPGRGKTEPRGREKLAFVKREARNREAEESGTDEEKKHPERRNNQLSLMTVTEGPGRGTTEPRGREKPAFVKREARNREADESGTDGEKKHPRTKQEDEEEAGSETNIAAAWQA